MNEQMTENELHQQATMLTNDDLVNGEITQQQWQHQYEAHRRWLQDLPNRIPHETMESLYW